MEVNKIYQGNCIDIMKTFPDKCIDLTVTSPPYDNLRVYKSYEFNFEEIAKELYRITKQGGVVVWVVGDSTTKGSESGTSFKQALYFKEIGFNLHDTMIYAKESYTPLTHNRYEQQFEYMFVFSKGKPKTFNPIRINCNQAGINKKSSWAFVSGSSKERNSAVRSNRHEEHIVREYKIKPNIWFYKCGKNHTACDSYVFEHPAVFPEKLAEDHILSWSNKEDIVLDPMCGSGTTLKMAKINGRNFIGIECSEEYCKIVERRVSP